MEIAFHLAFKQLLWEDKRKNKQEVFKGEGAYKFCRSTCTAVHS